MESSLTASGGKTIANFRTGFIMLLGLSLGGFSLVVGDGGQMFMRCLCPFSSWCFLYMSFKTWTPTGSPHRFPASACSHQSTLLFNCVTILPQLALTLSEGSNLPTPGSYTPGIYFTTSGKPPCFAVQDLWESAAHLSQKRNGMSFYPKWQK